MYVTEIITEREKSKYLDNISVLPTSIFIFDKFVDDAQPEVVGEIVGRRHILRTLHMYLFFMNILYFRSQFKANPVNTKILQTNLSKIKIEVGKTEMLSRYLLFSRSVIISVTYIMHPTNMKPTLLRHMKRCHGHLHYDRKFKIFIFLIGYIIVDKLRCF
jgi:hypothetical protein